MKNTKSEKFIVDIFWRSFFLQALWNFERMQNVGFVFALMPLLKALYPDREKRKKAILRHMEFFNTNPYMVNIIFGLVSSMEEEAVERNSEEFKDIDAIKINTAGPLAAIGDKFFWATWRPFCALVSIVLIFVFYYDQSFDGTWLAPLFYIVFYNIFIFPFRFWSLIVGSRFRTRIIKIIAGLEFKYLTDIVRYAGVALLIGTVIFYLIFFAHSVKMLMIFMTVFALSVLLSTIRLSSGMITYIVVGLCVVLAWFKI
jgi:PTS system mannose-specific IID component